MGQHYTRNTISARKTCRKCGKETDHAVHDRRIAHCLECQARLEREHAALAAETPAAVQMGLELLP